MSTSNCQPDVRREGKASVGSECTALMLAKKEPNIKNGIGLVGFYVLGLVVAKRQFEHQALK